MNLPPVLQFALRVGTPFLVLGGLIGVLYLGFISLPDRYNPFAALDMRDQTAGQFTAFKLGRLRNNYPACLAAMRTSQVEFSPEEISSPRSGCGTDEGVRLTKSAVSYGGAIEMNCAAMAALIMWEHHSVIPAAQKLGTELVRIQNYGSYSCRNVNNAKEGRLSQHATANAIDIGGFVMKDGRTVSVLKDWGKETPEGQFLREVHASACVFFRGVLGPDYNALHANHFHFDMGRWNICS